MGSGRYTAVLTPISYLLPPISYLLSLNYLTVFRVFLAGEEPKCLDNDQSHAQPNMAIPAYLW
jgi:hypothetical protein